MRKRTSKRRWKARLRLGQWIPYLVVIQHRLRLPSGVENAINTDCVRVRA